MKTIKTFILASILVGFLSCNKDDGLCDETYTINGTLYHTTVSSEGTIFDTPLKDHTINFLASERRDWWNNNVSISIGTATTDENGYYEFYYTCFEDASEIEGIEYRVESPQLSYYAYDPLPIYQNISNDFTFVNQNRVHCVITNSSNYDSLYIKYANHLIQTSDTVAAIFKEGEIIVPLKDISEISIAWILFGEGLEFGYYPFKIGLDEKPTNADFFWDNHIDERSGPYWDTIYIDL